VSSILQDIENLVVPVLERENVELVDVTYQRQPAGWTLCFYIDKPDGVTLDDCTYWSHELGAVLDASPLLTHAYNLEVASPGLDRPLKKVKDFERFKGQRIHVRLYAPLNGQKNFIGELLGADEKVIRLRQEDKREFELDRTQVAKAKLDPIFKF
jgi:ribosome maturation factor RimP